MASPYLQVKLLSDTARAPTRGSSHAAGYDLYASAEASIPAGGRALVPLGISVAVPEDCYARIAPRSGLAVKAGISTGAGVVDCDYRGEVRVLLFNHGSETFKVAVGDRIAQMILEKVWTPEVEVVETLAETVRGAGGFGSTGQ
ncbi:deoxyuridine 5'-triphosphate nucleotidohydrolase [Protomyces lactucae-debilis]|uniref:Deoxyuridine 5'-triphosphate nucleotidohydrolase n=1 Tax=Protomyces lactucae-debilis TaxID=2754530 RepID=A0A1Y2EZZ8_PROLT|nr:deoxyuridine 5'-triphosphate nucleotidohydrolase [Protomyces lactucae-debilis]ORY76305.1 deoxyuridine 5'-triphosphate nucleotidohydrolase [Protomyces lactucae-debilis]